MSKTGLQGAIRTVSLIVSFGLVIGGLISIFGAFVNAGSEVPVLSLTLGPTACIVGPTLIIFSVRWPGFRP